MKMVRKLVNGVIDLFTVLIVAYLIFLGVCGGLKCVPYIVLSGSMEPSIRTGSLCVVDTGVPFEQIKSGDVIAFETGTGQLVTHRVVSFVDGAIETKGDANTVTDGFTTTIDNYRGKTLFSIPGLGYVIKQLQTVRGKIISASAFLFLLLFSRFADEVSGTMGQGRRRKGGSYGRDEKYVSAENEGDRKTQGFRMPFRKSSE